MLGALDDRRREVAARHDQAEADVVAGPELVVHPAGARRLRAGLAVVARHHAGGADQRLGAGANGVDEPAVEAALVVGDLGGRVCADALGTQQVFQHLFAGVDDGKKYVIPKPLESGILKNKDYTTKTQEAAALRKQLESREVEINQRLEATEQELDARAELRGISAQLSEYAKLTAEDWQYHLQQDPLGTQQARMQFEMLRDRKAELDGVLSKTTSERSEKAQQDLAKRVQDTIAEAPKIIPGWTPETANKTMDELVSFVTSEMEIPEQVLKDLWSPKFLKFAHRAHLGHNLLTKQATAPKPAPTVIPQPLQTVAGKTSAPTSGDLASLDMEAYIAARRKGVGGKPLR